MSQRRCNCGKCYLCNLYANDERYMDIGESKPGGISAFLSAMKVETQWRAGGGSPPTEAERQRRRELCNGCSKRDVSNDSCSLCGCYLEAGLIPPRPLGKLDCATQECPLKLWGFAGDYEGTKCGGCGKK